MPYIPPTRRPTTAPAAAASPTQPTATTTPTFGKSVFERADSDRSRLYAPPASRTVPTTPTEAAPALGAVVGKASDADLTSVARPITNESQQSTWQRRKPVPSGLILPNESMPSSHPFARANTLSAKASPRDETPTTPLSPLSPRHTGPVPPRRQGQHSRTVSLNRWESPTSPADSDLADRPGLFWSAPPKQPTPTGDEVEMLQPEEVRASKAAGTAAHGDGPKEEVVKKDFAQTNGTGKPSLRRATSLKHSPEKKALITEWAETVRRNSGRSTSKFHPHSDAHTSRSATGTAAPTEAEAASSDEKPDVTTTGSGTPPPTVPLPPQADHPLRMRIDKSLPALPLDAEPASPVRPTRANHAQHASTSSDPSTQIITPRSANEPFPPDSAGTAEGEGEKHRYWPKRLGVLQRGKKDKAKEKGDGGLDSKEAHSASQPTKANLSRRVSLLPMGEPEEDETFSVDRIPSKRRLWEAGTLFVRDENGELVCFGDMFPKMPTSEAQGKPIPKTAVFFIRHFWCGQCQDFMFASLSQLDPEALERAGIRVVVISNGSWKIIKSYRKLFNCPFPIYVDGPRKLYQLMGMTKMTNDFGPLFKGRAAYHQRNVPKQLLHGGKNALTKMPLAYPGKLTQLGGEFVLSPGYNCDFAHRMTNTSNHMEAPDVLRQAGCANPTKDEVQEITIAEHQQAEFDRIEQEMRAWRTERESELERIRRRRAERRGEAYQPMASSSLMALGLARDESEPEQAQVAAVPLPADSPSSASASGSGDSSPSPSPAKVNGHSASNGDTFPNGDGPKCLPINSLEDVLAWEPESKYDNDADRRDMDEKFAAAMRDEGLHPGPEATIDVGNGRPVHVGDTFGRKASGTGNGLDVIVEGRPV